MRYGVRRSCALLLAGALWPSPVGALTDDDTLIRVNVVGRTRASSAQPSKPPEKLRAAKEGRNNVELRSESRLELVVEDYNPLLFEYSVKVDPPVETADFAAALEFAKVVAKLAKSTSLGADNARLTINGFSPTDFRKTLMDIQELVPKIPGYIGRTTRDRTALDQVRTDVAAEKIEQKAKAIEQGYEQVTLLLQACLGDLPSVRVDNGDSIDCDAPFAWALSTDRVTREKAVADANVEITALKLRDLETRLKLDELKRISGASPSPTARRDMRELENKLAEHSTKLTALNTTLGEAERRRNEARAGFGNQTMRDFLNSVASLKDGVLDQVRLLRDFAQDLALVAQPTTVGEPIAYSLKDQPFALTLKSRARYEKVRGAEVDAIVRKYVGDYLFTVHAHAPARFSVGGAAVAGLFIKNPTFTAVKEGDAFVIKRKDDDPAIFKVAAMLNITPASWKEPTFGGFFQLGITPDPDSYGFYFGTGIRAYSVFSFGGGLMIQQVRKLGPGLTMDTRLDDPAKLKTESEFKPGLYFHFTATLPK
jgi:hypothetical protein